MNEAQIMTAFGEHGIEITGVQFTRNRKTMNSITKSGCLRLQQALEAHGFHDEAEAVGAIRRQRNWSRYARRLVSSVQRSMRAHSDIRRLRFLLYPSALRSEDAEAIRGDDAGVTWLT